MTPTLSARIRALRARFADESLPTHERHDAALDLERLLADNADPILAALEMKEAIANAGDRALVEALWNECRLGRAMTLSGRNVAALMDARTATDRAARLATDAEKGK